MQSPNSILVLHAAAIGDAVLATPVLVSLKRSFPGARLVYMSHPSVFSLISLTGVVDDFVPWDKSKSIFEQAGFLKDMQPDLVVDLIDSLRSKLLCLLLNKRTVRYHKHKSSGRQVHAVDNFLQTLDPLKIQKIASFPTLTPPSEARSLAESTLNSRPCVAIVPGVGKNRPSRSWPRDNWIELGKKLQSAGFVVGVVGGAEDAAECAFISHQLDESKTLDMAGRLSLVETAAFLAVCRCVVSGDTGPAHIAVAVGTDVVSIMGPTFAERSGPFGMQEFCISASSQCQCTALKFCKLEGDAGPGNCMKSVDVDRVWAQVQNCLAKRSVGSA